MGTIHYKILGFLALVLGFIGALLPLMPTTCFVLLAAWCFAKSSPKWHAWLLNSRLFGETIRQWEQHRYIPPRARFIAISTMLVSGLISLLLLESLLLQLLLIGLIAIGIYSVRSFRFRPLENPVQPPSVNNNETSTETLGPVKT